MKEKEELFLRKQEEAKDYEAKYHIAESKRLAAASHINELTMVMSDEETENEPAKEETEAELRRKYHLAQKEKEVTTVDNMCWEYYMKTIV